MTSYQIPFDIDEAKLTPPMMRPASVKKAAAISALLASSAPIACITAPAGYGKTTLLGRWAQDDSRDFAWVALDARDDDELVLLRDIAAAIHRVVPLARSVFDGLSGPGGSIWNRVPRVGNAIAAIARPIVVALDDLHSVTSSSCLSVLASLVDYVPPGSQIVVTSREKPALPLARWRAQGMLFELDTADLRLAAFEADSLLQGASVALDPADVAELTLRTEGWPAGLYLAALSIRSGAPDAASAKGFSGGDRYVSEYFRQEVMSRLPRREAQFVMRTSVLDTLNGPLCDAVLETRGSGRMLESLERSNRFVVPLDNRGDSFRYHHLFCDLLRNELERTEPEIVPALNRRAMTWCIANDELEAAVRYGRAAGDVEAIAGLVDQLALPLHYDGRMDTLGELLDWFDNKDLMRFPAIAVYAAWVRAMTGRAPEASRYLAFAERSTSSIPLSDGSPTIEPWIATLRAAMMPDGIDRALADANTALAQLPPGSAWRPDATTMRGIAEALAGSTDRAGDHLLAAVEVARAAGAVDTQLIALAELALLDAKRGAWFEAARHAEEARAIVERAHLEHYGLSAIAHVAVARVAVHRHRHADARAAMTRAHRLRPLMDHALPWLTVQVGIELTRAHLALGEVDAARAILGETVTVLDRRPDLGTLVDEVSEMRARVAATTEAGPWAVNLTAAELRLLPYLATYLTFPEIAGQLFITSHTVRSEAKAIYRKLDATSRAEAIARAIDVGLLEPMFPHRASVAS